LSTGERRRIGSGRLVARPRRRGGAASRPPAAAVAAGTIPATVEVVLVVEGAARGIDPADGVRVVAGSGSGDDEIARLAVSPTLR
jgi:hypothetical protein